VTATTDLPLTVLSGYLGAGKTTLLRRLLQTDHGRRIGVLVNDFGAVGLDARLLADAAAETVELVNGCVCCALADDLGRGLDTLLDVTPRLDQVILEASGVADPGRLAALARTWPGYRYDGTFVCVDVTRIRLLADDRFVGSTVRRQLHAADVIVLTHLDECADLDAVERWLDTQGPGAPHLRGGGDPGFLLMPAQSMHRHHTPADSAGDVDATHAPQHTYRTWTARFAEPVTRDEIDTLMRRHPTLLRAKGEVWLNEDPDRRHVLQRVGPRWEITAVGTWNTRAPGTAIDCIAPA